MEKLWKHLLDLDQNVQDNSKTGKKAKGVKKCVTRKNIKFNDYKERLMNNKKNNEISTSI